MIVEEPGERLCRIIEHASGRRRPDAGGHRHEIAVAERTAEARLFDEVADGEVEILGLVEKLRRHAVETQDVVCHAQEGGAGQVAPLGEVAGEGACIFEPAVIEADGEGHVRRLGWHAEMVEQGNEIGIVALVEDDESDIDRQAPLLRRRFDRAGVSAEAVLPFVDDHVVAAAEEPGGPKTGHAGADDGDFHSESSPWMLLS